MMLQQTNLWSRLALLDESCHVSMHSLYIPDDLGSARREWEVLIRLKAPESALIRVRDPSLARGITRALDEADTRGWAEVIGPANRNRR